MINGTLWCSLVSVSLFFILMMDLKDVGEKWIDYENSYMYVETFCVMALEDASASMALAFW